MTYGDDRTAGAMGEDERRDYVRRSGGAMSDPTMPAGLAAILAELGWERKTLAETPHYYAYSGGPSTFGAKPDIVTVSFWRGDGWVCGFYPAWGGANAESVHAASELIRRIEQALEPAAALAQEGTS